MRLETGLRVCLASCGRAKSTQIKSAAEVGGALIELTRLRAQQFGPNSPPPDPRPRSNAVASRSRLKSAFYAATAAAAAIRD